MAPVPVASSYYLDLNEGGEGMDDNEEGDGLEEGADWAKSTAVKSRFDSKHFGKACQVIRALRNPKKKLLRPLFSSDEDRILTYELTVSILKYASFLNQALDASEFYKRHPSYKKENNEDVLVVLYDLFEREFQIHRDDPMLSQRFALLQQAVLGVRTKIMAHLARLRIQHQATTVNHLLPENLRHQKHIDQNPIYAWVNLNKAKLPLVLTALHEIGLQGSEFEDDILIQEESFYVDVTHNDLIRFHSSRKETIFNSTLVRDGMLIVQDKSACISVYAMVKALFFKENLNRDRRLTSANLFAGATTTTTTGGVGSGGHDQRLSGTMYGTYLGVPISIPPCDEWYENILETTNKKESKPDCIIVTHGGSCRSVAHLACLLQESVPKWLSKNTEMSLRDDLATAISNKFIPRPPLNVVAFGVPASRQEEIVRFCRKQMQLHNVRLYTEDFVQVSPKDPRIKNACAILVNPPSSGSALKDPVSYICTEGGDEDVLVHLSKFVHSQTSTDTALKYTSSQSKFLKHALNFSQAKLVLYTTCSLLQVENGDVVNEAVTEFHEEFHEHKIKIFNEILYEKRPIRFYKESQLELIDLSQVLDSYAKQNFNGPFMEMPPSSASSGCFMALIRRKEVIISIEKNHVKSINSSNQSESTCPDQEFSVPATTTDASHSPPPAPHNRFGTDHHLTSLLGQTASTNSSLVGGEVITNYGHMYLNSSFDNGFVTLAAPISGSTTNSIRSSRSAGGGESHQRLKKRSMTKKAIVQRVSIPTHASLAKQTRKWTAENREGNSNFGQKAGLGGRFTCGHSQVGHGHCQLGKGSSVDPLCHACARHVKKFPDLFREQGK